jgi:hypothetical protein
MKKLGKELDFISLIKRDGSGVVAIGGKWTPEMNHPKTDDMSYVDDDSFIISCLSGNMGTYIAYGFNSFVVRLKPQVVTSRTNRIK